MRQGCLIKILWILLWRTQNPTITKVSLTLRSFPIIWKFARPKPTICTKNNSTTLKVVLRPELKLCKSLVLKWNQVYEKTASKQPQVTKCNFSMIFEWKWTNMRHLRPYKPQKATELQDEFWVRQSKIHQILITLIWCILWWFELQKMGIFWKLTKFWMI